MTRRTYRWTRHLGPHVLGECLAPRSRVVGVTPVAPFALLLVGAGKSARTAARGLVDELVACTAEAAPLPARA